MTTRTLTNRTGRQLTTDLTDEQAAKILRDKDTRTKFERDLLSRPHPTDEQLWWIHHLALRARFEITGHSMELPKILAMMHKAADAAKTSLPHVRFDYEGQTIDLKVVGARGKFPGSINVSNGKPYGQATWYGRITTDGIFHPSRDINGMATNALEAFEKDPARLAAEYGRKSGRCCFCRTAIRTDESIAVGYGPFCAQRYGLPWGEVPEHESIPTNLEVE